MAFPQPLVAVALAGGLENDWAGRYRRQAGNLVAPEVIRRATSSKDSRLRLLFEGARGLPFTPTDEL